MITTNLQFSRTTRALELACQIDAPPERVFEVWTRRFAEWWGPHGMTTPHSEMDLRPGGVFRTLMRAPDGTEYRTRGVFLEVVPGHRIVFTDAFDPGWQPHPDIFFTAVISFETASGRRTRLTASARHWSEESCRRHEQMGFAQGWGESLDRLAALAAAAPAL